VAANFLAALWSDSSIRRVTHPAAPVAADVPIPRPPRRAGSQLLSAVCFGVAFACVCAALGWASPFPEVPGIAPKWNYFQQRREQFNVVFLGSSRFFHQIIPAQFDAAVAAAGGPATRSFNFAYDGMWPPESYYLVRQILATRPPQLKWLVIDLMDINAQLDSRNNSTMRMTYWHDAQHTWMALREVFASRQRWSIRQGLLLQHSRLWLTRVTQLGRGSDLLGERLNPRGPRKKPYSWTAHEGFEVGPERQMEGAAREEFERTVAGLRKGLRRFPVRPLFRDALTDLIADVRAAGVEPIFVIAPTINPRENFVDLPSGAPLVALNDPVEYPELFASEFHYDPWHLNGAGAIRFTDLLAKRFIAHTQRQP
jgi:hypothetical protein